MFWRCENQAYLFGNQVFDSILLMEIVFHIRLKSQFRFRVVVRRLQNKDFGLKSQFRFRVFTQQVMDCYYYCYCYCYCYYHMLLLLLLSYVIISDVIHC